MVLKRMLEIKCRLYLARVESKVSSLWGMGNDGITMGRK